MNPDNLINTLNQDEARRQASYLENRMKNPELQPNRDIIVSTWQKLSQLPTALLESAVHDPAATAGEISNSVYDDEIDNEALRFMAKVALEIKQNPDLLTETSSQPDHRVWYEYYQSSLDRAAEIDPELYELVLNTANIREFLNQRFGTGLMDKLIEKINDSLDLKAKNFRSQLFRLKLQLEDQGGVAYPAVLWIKLNQLVSANFKLLQKSKA